MIHTSLFQFRKPLYTMFFCYPYFFANNINKGGEHVRRHFFRTTCNVYCSIVKEHIRHPCALFPHFMLDVNLFSLLPREGNIKPSTRIFWKYTTTFWMRLPKVFIQKIILFVAATKEENNRSSCGTRFSLYFSFLQKSMERCATSSRSNENEGKWWLRRGKRTFIEPYWDQYFCSKIIWELL